MRRVSEVRRSFALQIGSIGVGFLLALAPACSDASAGDKSGSESDPGALLVGTQVVPVDSRVMIHRATVRVLAMVAPDLTEPIPPAPGDLSRPQTRKLDIPADEVFLFRITRVGQQRVEVTSRDERTSGWLKRDQVVPLKQADAHLSRAVEKNAGDAGALVHRARLRIVERKWESALADFDAAIRLDPKSATAYKARSDLYIAIGDFDAANVDVDEYVKLESKNASFFLSRARRWLDRNKTGRALLDIQCAENIDPDHPGVPLIRYEYWKLKGEFDRALAELDAAIRRDPTAAAAYELRAESLAASENLDRAVADLDSAIKLEPDDPQLFCARGALWSMLDESDKAIADYSRAIGLDPGISESYLKRADVWSAQNQHDKAIADYSESIKLAPDNAEAFLSRGKEWQAKGDLARSIADFTEAIRLCSQDRQDADPFDALTYQGLRCRGDALLQKKEFAQAIADYDRIIDQNPWDCEALYRRGCARLDLKQLDQAIEDFNRAIDQEPTRGDIYYTRGCAWSEKQEYDEAIADLTEAIVLDPEDANASWRYVRRGHAWKAKHEFDRAIADFTEAIKLQPHDPALYLQRGNVWVEKKDFSRAIADLSAAVKQAPKVGGFYAARGVAFHKNKEYPSALEDFGQAISLDLQNSASYLLLRSNVWVEKKDLTSAIADLSAAIKKAPTVASFYTARGMAFRRNKEYDRAMQDLDQAIRLDKNWWSAYSHKAWISATCPEPAYRDGKKAISLATQGCDLIAWKSPFALECLAAAYAEAGEFKAAVRWQKKTIELLSADDTLRPRYLERLAQFERRQPYREQPDD